MRREHPQLHPDLAGLLLIALFSVSGAVLSVFLTIIKFRSEYRCDSTWTSACTGAWFDCNRVLASNWSAPFFNLPISVYSTAYYLVLLGLAGAALWRPARMLPVVRPFILCLTWAGVVVISGLILYAALWVRAFCTYCMVIYGITWGIFLATALMHTQGQLRGFRVLFERRMPRRGSVALLVVLAFLAMISAQMVQYRRAAAHLEFERCVLSADRFPETSVQSTTERPRVQISLFVDLACESCRQEYTVWRDFVKRNPEEHRLAIYHYARAGDCIPPDFEGMSATAEANDSCLAAQAVECAERLEKEAGLRVMDALFELQDRPSPYFTQASVGAAARASGFEDVPSDSFDHPLYRCLLERETIGQIVDHAVFGMEHGLHETPVTFLTFYREDGTTLPRVVRIKGTKRHGNLERTLEVARRAAEGDPIAAKKAEE